MKFDEIIRDLKNRRERVIKGEWNCLPLPFPRYRNILPGTEQGKYIILSANQKVGKSKLCDYLWVYELIFFMVEHPEFKAKVLYFTLEMSPKEKYNEFLCHLLARLNGIYMTNTNLKSTDKDKPVDIHIFELLESERYKTYIRKFEEVVEYIDSIKNPTGVNKYCRDFAESNGHYNYTTYEKANEITGKLEERQMLDPINPFTWNDPNMYVFVLIDNASNLSTEKGMDIWGTINKMSKYAITLKSQLNMIVVLIQHQAQDKEGNESFKLGRIKPSSDGLADCKVTSRDADIVIGLYSPFKYGLAVYEGYDIKRFKNYIRFMEVIEDRHYGATGNICPLFFNGASSIFYELPKPDNTRELSKVYDYMNSLESRRTSKSFFSFISKPSESKYKLNELRKEINLGKRNFNIRKIRHR